MSTATSVKLIAEKYYAKLWLGDGDAPDALDLANLPSGFDDNTSYFADPVAKTTIWVSAPEETTGYGSYTTTGNYVDKYVLTGSSNGPYPRPSCFTKVTAGNKDSLGIVPGTTVAYNSPSVVYDGMPLPVQPQLGWFYLDATTGKLYVYCGDDTTPWTEAGTWTGGFL